MYTIIAPFSVAASYEEDTLEFFGRKHITNRRKICTNTNTNDELILLNKHRDIAITYALYFINLCVWVPSVPVERYYEIMNSINLDPFICDNNLFDCSDLSTPWGLAKTVTDEFCKFSKSDGWNADGSLSRKYNRIPYSDFRNRRYIPKNNPWILRKEDNWQPLLENDGLGFLFNQEHVIPHVGFTGKSIYLSNDYFCDLESPDPKYNYDSEMELVIDRMKDLTDEQKMEIELFDCKSCSLLVLLGQYQIINIQVISTTGTIEYHKHMSGAFIALYEGTLAVWRQKIKHDLVRPTTLIQNKLRDTEITTYSGTDTLGNSFGTQTFLGNDFEAYIRTMPHSEYPSGSACVCWAFAQFMIRYTGNDDFIEAYNTTFKLNVPAFSSKYEPLSTPKQDLVLEYKSWSEIAEKCSQSRLNGGMHFTQSIVAGKELCINIGNIVFEAIDATDKGITPNYVANPNDLSIKQDRCRKKRNH